MIANSAARLAHRTRELARNALAAEQESRAALYGEVVATCAACHTSVRVELP